MYRLFKRPVDIVLSITGLLLFFPLLVLAALLIKLEDGGPLFFRQKRVGFRRKPFLVIKFRTMREDKVTNVGRILRSRGLDEIPQAINVLLGDMSIVGPRPLTIADIERLGWDKAYCDLRFSVKPGITGLAQIYGGLGQRYTWALDKSYVSKLSMKRDIWIIVASFAVNLGGKKKVREWLMRKK